MAEKIPEPILSTSRHAESERQDLASVVRGVLGPGWTFKDVRAGVINVFQDGEFAGEVIIGTGSLPPSRALQAFRGKPKLKLVD